MVRSRPNEPPANRLRKSNPQRRNGSAELDKNLESVLASLSQLLVASGYGFHRAMRMAKQAFVEAARNLEGGKKKVSIARIAASTGITRVEVSRILRTSARNSSNFAQPQNRAAQVALGWITDNRFSDDSHHGRALKFSGKSSSFTALTKSYSGDIPARAMLTEMKRLGMVRQTKDGAIRLVRTEARVPRTAVSAMRAISPWVTQLSQFSQASRQDDLTSTTNHIRLCFASIPQVLAAIRLLGERKIAFVDAISELGGHSAQKSKFAVEVTIAVAATKPSKIALRKPHQKN